LAIKEFSIIIFISPASGVDLNDLKKEGLTRL